MAGPLLWPAEEPWPVCAAVHPKGTGRLLPDVRMRRRIQEEARGREYTEDEQRLLDGMTQCGRIPNLQDDGPSAMLAVAHLYAREVPDLFGPEGHDLLQVFWCPFEVHGGDHTVDVVLKWRRSADVGAVLTPQPEPLVVGRAECVPTMCVVHPERVVVNRPGSCSERRARVRGAGPSARASSCVLVVVAVSVGRWGWRV